MPALAGSEDITVALGGSNTSHMEEPGTRSLLKWKQQVKIMTTRITVINRFARKYHVKSLQCGIVPGLTVEPPQIISTVKDQGLKTKPRSTGALFSPNDPVQDEPKQMFELRTLEKKNGEGFPFKVGDVFKDHRALSTIQTVLTLLACQILKEADLLDEAIGALIIVTVIALDSRQEGTTATYNPVGRTVSLKGLLLLLCLSTFMTSGVSAQDDSKDGKLEGPNERVDLPFIVQAAAWTFVAIIFTIAVIARINRRPLVPATAAAPLALPLAAVPLAVPAPAIPMGAAAPLAVLPAAVPPGAPPAAPAAPAPAIPMGFVNVMDGLNENPDPARRGDPDFDIPPHLQMD